MGGMYRETGMFRYKELVRPHESVHALPEPPLLRGLAATAGVRRGYSAGRCRGCCRLGAGWRCGLIAFRPQAVVPVRLGLADGAVLGEAVAVDAG